MLEQRFSAGRPGTNGRFWLEPLALKPGPLRLRYVGR
jgi:hypothetical protein